VQQMIHPKAPLSEGRRSLFRPRLLLDLHTPAAPMSDTRPHRCHLSDFLKAPQQAAEKGAVKAATFISSSGNNPRRSGLELRAASKVARIR